MANIYQTKTGKWAVDVTVGGKRYRRVVGKNKSDAVKALQDLLGMQIEHRKLKLYADVGKSLR